MEQPIISVSGLRGILGRSLTPEVAMRYSCAFAADAPKGSIFIARDGRASGPMLAEAIRSGLAGMGRECVDAGVAATPTLGVLVREHGGAGGIQITASHNPAEYNGLKLITAEGRAIAADDGLKVIERYRNDRIDWASHRALGSSRPLEDSTGAHLKRLLENVDVERIRNRRFRVVLDANHGSGSILGRLLLEELGCQTVVLGEEPDGNFKHPPEPTAENLRSIFPAIIEMKADVGFCQDPDADRLAIIDERGHYPGEEYTLALVVDHVLRSRPGPIVMNCSTSRMSEDIARRYGAPVFRSAVGEVNVVDSMLANDAVIGGEGNGGVIDPRVVLIRDSFATMVLLLEAMVVRERKISELIEELPRYSIVKTKVTMPPAKVALALDTLAARFPEATADRMDGLRLDWPDKWLLVRPSNTEPIVRAVAEAADVAEASRLCDEAADAMESV